MTSPPAPGQHNHAAETEWETVRSHLEAVGMWAASIDEPSARVEEGMTEALSALSSLKARHAELQEKFGHLHAEWGYGHVRGDHLVYEAEWEAFDAWQRSDGDARLAAAEARLAETERQRDAAQADLALVARWLEDEVDAGLHIPLPILAALAFSPAVLYDDAAHKDIK